MDLINTLTTAAQLVELALLLPIKLATMVQCNLSAWKINVRNFLQLLSMEFSTISHNCGLMLETIDGMLTNAAFFKQHG